MQAPPRPRLRAAKGAVRRTSVALTSSFRHARFALFATALPMFLSFVPLSLEAHVHTNRDWNIPFSEYP